MHTHTMCTRTPACLHACARTYTYMRTQKQWMKKHKYRHIHRHMHGMDVRMDVCTDAWPDIDKSVRFLCRFGFVRWECLGPECSRSSTRQHAHKRMPRKRMHVQIRACACTENMHTHSLSGTMVTIDAASTMMATSSSLLHRTSSQSFTRKYNRHVFALGPFG